MAYARKTSDVGVATVTCGPGVTQLVTALPAAVRAHLPLVVFAGEARNLTRGTTAQLPPMPEVLQPIIAQGGADGQLAAWLTGHPAQRASEGAPSALRSGQPVTVVRKAGAAASA